MATTFSALRLVLDVKAHAPCPMCGGDGWAGGDRVSAIPELHAGGEPIEVFPLICRNCGFVRLHAISPLATIDD